MPIDVPTCRHREREVATDRWVCRSSKLVIPGRVVAGHFCRSECPYVDHEVVGEGIAPSCRAQPLKAAGRLEVVSDAARQALHPSMSVEEMIAALDAGSRRYPPGWQDWEVVHVAQRVMFERAAQRMPSPPPPCAGRGIVMAAGGPVYFSMGFICAYVLRRQGCTLPIEFWHLGHEELDSEMADVAGHLGIVCRDASAVASRPRRLKGWELKPFAVMNSAFEQALFLDADNLPLRNPEYLFDDPRISRLGAIFWPDLPQDIQPRIWIPDLAWDIAGIADRQGPAFESGQFLIDKSQCWEELNLAMYLNEHSDFWYRYLHGDKDTFKLAWHKLRREFAMTSTPAGWRWPAILQHDLDGQLLFAHACQGKAQLINGERLDALPVADLAIEASHALRKQWTRTPYVSVVVTGTNEPA